MEQILTEDQIETIAERRMDSLDKKLMKHQISQHEYDREVLILDKWTAQQHKYAQEQTA